MRDRKFKIFLSVLISLSLLIIFCPYNISNASYPETVKIGLYYGGDSVSSVALNSSLGLEIGVNKNGAFTKFFDESTANNVIVRKDAYFIKTNDGQTLEYNPGEGMPYQGEAIGPYHVKIGDTYNDYITASNVALNIKQQGIDAYPVYENGWQVWTGFYKDATTANSQVGTISSKTGSNNLIVVPPSPTRTVVLNSSYKVYMMFDSIDGYLYFRPNANSNPYAMQVNSRSYRGEIEIRRYNDSDMTVINILPLEQYLYGVVPAEMPHSWPLEALKAQAVAARTYAYRCIGGSYRKWGFDMTDTVLSQVYLGIYGERQSTNTAVDQTAGKKILYNGKLAQVFYFSSSGGRTADVKNVWGSDVPYLKSVEDPYEPVRIWQKVLTPEEIKKILFIKQIEIGDIVSVTAESYSVSDRVTKLRITGTKDDIVFYQQDCRNIFGLSSQKYTISSSTNAVARDENGEQKVISVAGSSVVSGNGTSTISGGLSKVAVVGGDGQTRYINMTAGNFVFDGKGKGHGIGLSQTGAMGMAEAGFTYDQIIKHYYTGVTVE